MLLARARKSGQGQGVLRLLQLCNFRKAEYSVHLFLLCWSKFPVEERKLVFGDREIFTNVLETVTNISWHFERKKKNCAQDSFTPSNLNPIYVDFKPFFFFYISQTKILELGFY